MPRSNHQPWLVLQEGNRRRWGGDLRRAFIFRALGERTSATIAAGWSIALVRSGLASAGGLRRPPTFRRRRPLVATSESLGTQALSEVRRHGVPFALDVHDDPLAQYQVFGIQAPDERLAELRAGFQRNLDAFVWHVVQSARFAEMTGLAPERTILAPNGSDTSHVRPGPLPSTPTIGFVSGAAAGRGIETLVAAARLVREQVRDLQLRLWLVPTGDLGRAYLAVLNEALRADRWITTAAVPYDRLGDGLAGATVLCIPHPANAYLDAVLPVKLFDSMAAGRPVVVTPRIETRRVVEQAGAGLVAAGDRPEDLAEALLAVLRDPDLAARLGAAGRVAAERDYDWRVIGERLAEQLLERAGP